MKKLMIVTSFLATAVLTLFAGEEPVLYQQVGDINKFLSEFDTAMSNQAYIEEVVRQGAYKCDASLLKELKMKKECLLAAVMFADEGVIGDRFTNVTLASVKDTNPWEVFTRPLSIRDSLFQRMLKAYSGGNLQANDDLSNKNVQGCLLKVNQVVSFYKKHYDRIISCIDENKLAAAMDKLRN